jgi:hypothetical protein
MRSFLPVIAVLLPVCLQAGTVYTVTDLGLLPGGSITAASGISSNGLVVGSGDTDTAFSLPFLWTAGPGLSVVDPVNSQFAFGAGVNAAGVVVGSELNNDSGAFRPFFPAALTISPRRLTTREPWRVTPRPQAQAEM